MLGLFLMREPPIPNLQDLTAAFSHDVSQQVPAKLLCIHILHRLLLMQTKADKTLRAAYAQYKKHFGKSVWNLLMFDPGWLCLLQSTTFSENCSRANDRRSWSKFQPKTVGRLQVIYTTSHTIILDENDIKTVSPIDQAMLAPQPRSAPLVEQLTRNSQIDIVLTIEQSIQHALCDPSTLDEKRDKTHRVTGCVSLTPSAACNINMYVNDHIVRHINAKDTSVT